MGILSGIKDKLVGGGSGGRGVSEADVKAVLSRVKDPDLHQDIVALGFVRNIVIGADSVSVEVNLTTPACPVKEQLKAECETQLKTLPGISKVDVKMTATTRSSQSAAAGTIPALARVKNIVAVASGKGGVGKSTSAVNLAYALARAGSKVGLLDADVYGPSIPRMVKITKPTTQAADGTMLAPPEADGIKVISAGMFLDGMDAATLRGPRAGGVVKQFLTQVDWGELDYLIIDYPPGTGDIQLTISQTAPVTGAIIVTTPQEVALIDVRRAISMFKTLKVPVLGVVETMSYFLCDGCDKKHFIFRQGGGERLAREYGVSFLGGIPLEPAVAVGGDEGRAYVTSQPDAPASKAYAAAAGAAAAQLSILSAQAAQQGGALNQFTLEWKH